MTADRDPPTAPAELLTLGQVGDHYRIQGWKVARLFDRGILPPPRKVGVYRVVSRDQLPVIEEALRRAGYLPAERQP